MYDNVCKFLAETYSSDFSQWLLGESIPLTQLSPSELQVEPIRADALILLESENTVLHLEFQTQADPSIPFRMADYRLRVYRRYPQKQMRQVVIYLKPSNSELVEQTVFAIPGTRHEFEVIRLWEQPVEELLQFPGLLPLAVLGETENRVQTLREINQQIEAIENQRQRSNVSAATSILAGLRLEKELIQQILREEIMKESVIYQEIVAQATAKGRAEGLQQGLQQGRLEGEATLILRLLRRRIGEIAPDLERTIRELSVTQLENLGEALLDFNNRDDLLYWLENRQ
ncbi:MAG: Rpn family recombination-promoting nuclease/putative transposase [Cyanobacteria bacterium J06592_8]